MQVTEFEKFGGKIILADWFEAVDDIPDNTIGLIVTDPPYNISHEMRINRTSQGSRYKGNDLTADFGIWDHFDSIDQFREFCETWIDLCAVKLIPGGYFVTFFDKRRISWVFDILEPCGFKVRDILVWVKSNPVPQLRKVKFAQATEFMAVLSKPGPNKFQWQEGYHPNVIEASIVGGHERLKDKEGKTLHPTQKPLKVMQWLIRYFSAVGDTILDPFCGTGTTAEAAALLGRKFICIDSNESYINAAIERLNRSPANFAQLKLLEE